MFKRIKELYKEIPTRVKWYIGITLLGILIVVWVCGIKGNNQDNFYYRGDKVAWGFPSKPNTPIIKKSDAQVDTSQLRKGINIVKGKLVIKTT